MADLDLIRRMIYGGGGLGSGLSNLPYYEGAIPTEQIEDYTGPLPGGELASPGHLGMILESLTEGLGGPLVGLAERVGLAEEGSRRRLRDEFETARLGYLSEDPGLLRAIIAGGSEIGASAIPYVPAYGVAARLSALAPKLNIGVPALARGISAAEGALIGFGETAGEDPITSAAATALGAGGGALFGGAPAKYAEKKGWLATVDKDLDDLTKSMRKWLTSSGDLPKEIYERRITAVGAIRDDVLTARINSGRLKEAISNYSEKYGIPQDIIERNVNTALTIRPQGGGPGGVSYIDKLPEELRPHVQALRTHVDELSTKIENSPLVTEELRKIIRENKGIYLHTSHAVFDDPEYAERFATPEGQHIWDKTFSFLKKETEWADEEVTALMERMLEEPHNAMELIGDRTFGMGKIDRYILKHRDNINPTIREFLGVYTDPYVNYMKSVAYMSNDVEWNRAFIDMRDYFLSTGQARFGPREFGEYKHTVKGSRSPLSGKAVLGDDVRVLVKDPYTDIQMQEVEKQTRIALASETNPAKIKILNERLDEIYRNRESYKSHIQKTKGKGISEYMYEMRVGDEDIVVELSVSKDGIAAIDVHHMLYGLGDEAANKVGPATMKAAYRRLKSMHPEIKEFTGQRLTGTRGITSPLRARGSIRSTLTDIKTPSPYGQLYFKDKDLADALSGMVDATESTVWGTINAVTKMAKTVGSVQTHFRNFLSGHFMMLLQGHNPYGSANKTAYNAAFGELNKLNLPFADMNAEGAMDAYRALLKKGIVGEGLIAEDIEYYLLRARNLLQEGGKVEKLTKEVAKLYRAEDDFWKINLYLKEFKRYRRAMPSAPDSEIQDIASSIVRDTMQIYSRIPKAVRAVRDFPLVGPFVAFPSEIARNVYNTMGIVRRELTNSNKEIRKIGMQRLSGVIGTLFVIPGAVGTFGRYISGVDKEKEESLRGFMPEWVENSQLVMLPSKDKDEYEYFDFSFIDPYNYMKKPVKALMRAITSDKGTLDNAIGIARETFDPFVTPEIAWSEFFNLLEELGKKKSGTPSLKAREIGYRLYRAFAPGTAITGERILRSLDAPGIKEVLPRVSKYGTKYDPMNELLAVIGPRVSSLNVKQAFQYKAREYTSARRLAARVYNEEERNKGQRSPYKLLKAKEEAEVINERSGKAILERIDAMRKLGISDSDMIVELRNGGMSLSNARMLIGGNIPPLRFSD